MISKKAICAMGLMFSTTSIAGTDWNTRKGMRFGYSYLGGVEEAGLLKGDDPDSRLASPGMFSMGFELQETREGGSWLDMLFIQNVTISGIDQSIVAPSASLLVGFEIQDQLQMAIGPNLSAFDPAEEENYMHLAMAVGYTAEAGDFSVPFHVVYIPDVNGFFRVAATTGVNW
ncbi:MAG: hypothetical protein ACPGTU_02570 [Myxococcota bacterium]